MPNYLLITIFVFVLLEYGVSTWLSWLNGTWMSHPIPAVLQGLYDDDKYARQQQYHRVGRRFASISRGVNLLVLLAFLAFGWFGAIDGWTKQLTEVSLLQLVLFLAVYDAVTTLVDLPFDYYSTFVIEERFGFNRTTHRTFWTDQAKSFAVSLLIEIVLLGIIFLLYQAWGQRFWLWASLVCMAFVLFFNLFYSNLIVPLFNKQTPLEAGPLRQAIEQAAAKMSFRISNIYVINGSKHSTKANAYFTGFGGKKRIVLYDTLIEQLSTEEIVAVLAHEIGHYKHHDTIKGMLQASVTIVAYLFLFSLLVGDASLPEALGGTYPSFPLSMIAFSLLLTPLNLVLEPLGNIVSRRAEYKADAFSASFGHGPWLISGLKKLSANTLSNLTPHPLYVWFNYSHPTLEQRILSIQNNNSLSQ